MSCLLVVRPIVMLLALGGAAVLGLVGLAGAATGLGDPNVVAQVKTQVLALQLAEQQLEELPHGFRARQAVVVDPSRVKARAERVHGIYAADVADDQAARYQNALRRVAHDRSYLPYQRVRVVLKDWRSVRVFGNHAWVQFTSQFEYWGQGQRGKPDLAGPVFWTMTLVRQGVLPFGGWRVESERGVPLHGL